MIATKEQELKALEKIRKIVADLGENSYIGMAFEGCFEMAEDNIGNDFGLSMKQQADKAREDADYFKGIAERATKEVEFRNAEIKKYKDNEIEEKDRCRLVNLLTEKLRDLDDVIAESAKEIVDRADESTSPEFKEAVRKNRNAKASYASYQELQERIAKTIS